MTENKREQPQKLSLTTMFSKIEESQRLRRNVWFCDGIVVAVDASRLLRPFMELGKGPYMLDDYRFGVVRRGSLRGIINLQEYYIEAGTAVFITPGTIVEPLEMSDDFVVTGLGMDADAFQLVHSGRPPEVFNGQVKSALHKIDDGERALLQHLFDALLHVADAQWAGRQVLLHAAAAVTCCFSDIFARPGADGLTRGTATGIFDRFLALVNNHCRAERRLAFYADKICLTERYLGTVVRQTSGMTAKEWIDRAVTASAKVMLKHSGKQVSQIAEELNFPNASFFCKYFKRLVGCTPQEYREQGQGSRGGKTG